MKTKELWGIEQQTVFDFMNVISLTKSIQDQSKQRMTEIECDHSSIVNPIDL